MKMRGQSKILSGQSMIEAIVALGILMTAVSAALTLVTAAVRANKESENGIVAANLAREAIEVARGLRDSNWLSDVPWDTGLYNAANPNDCTAIPVFDPSKQDIGFWQLDFSVDALTDATARVFRVSGSSDPLKPPGVFLQTAATSGDMAPTGFARLLTLKSICRDKSTPATDTSVNIRCACLAGVETKIGVQAVADILWAGRGGARSLRLEETFYNWR